MTKKNSNKFNTLGPVDLGENAQVYTEALNYAFNNNDIKDIAITGAYGAGKSSVWETFKKSRNLGEKDVLTIILGNYENQNEKKEENTENRVKEIDSRIEQQIINQILAQINTAVIPLSKYSFKNNKSKCEVYTQVAQTMFFLASVGLLYFNEPIIASLNLLEIPIIFLDIFILSSILFTISIVPLLLYIYNTYRIKNLKLKFRETEANLSSLSFDDETVLDRNIKEIVYLLVSSNVKVLVFEDLDRFNNIDIFVKLKEFNFLVNAYLKTNDANRVVKFVYLIKDGLFSSKDRTKFFDFILPVVPILDSRTSANNFFELIDRMQGNQNQKGEKLKLGTIVAISSYVDDMRLLKNIVNEYMVYSDIVPITELNLDRNQLFALITLKNIFPNEFELLQEDKGDIVKILDKIASHRSKLVEKYTNNNKRYENTISQIKENVFNQIAEYVPENISIDKVGENKKDKLARFLELWSNESNKFHNIIIDSEVVKYQYDRFLNEFIFRNNEIKSELEDQISNLKELETTLREKRKNKNKEIQMLKELSIKEILNRMEETDINKIFDKPDIELKNDYYFTLIRFLLEAGLLDETYWCYKNSFSSVSNDGFKFNDLKFIRGLYGDWPVDVLIEVESPKQIIKQLIEFDFSRKNILNINILKQCIQDNQKEKVESIVEGVNKYQNYFNFIKVIDKLDDEDCKKMIDIVIETNRLNVISNLLSNCNNNKVTELLLHAAFISEHTSIGDLFLLKKKLSEVEVTNSLMQRYDFDKFLKKIKSLQIKFKKVSNKDLNLEIVKKIEEDTLYELNIENVIYIVERILNKNVDYGNLLDVIYSSKELIHTKKYIEKNFEEFIHLYIHGNKTKKEFSNKEEIVQDVLKSRVTDKTKLEYLEYNKTKISNFLPTLKNKVIKKLLDNDFVEFSELAMRMLWLNLQTNIPRLGELSFSDEDVVYKDVVDQADDIEKSFVNYVCRYISKEFMERTVNDNVVLYRYLIMWPQVETILLSGA